MAQSYLYEPQYVLSGWFDDHWFGTGTGASFFDPLPWFDRDLTDDVLIKLNVLEPLFLDDDDVIFLLDGSPGTAIPRPLPAGTNITSGIWVELVAGFVDDDDVFFIPASVRALAGVDQMLKNEVRRIR